MCGCGDATSVEKPVPVAEPVGDRIENSIGMVLVPIPAGEFMMRDQPLHRVTLTKSFYLGRTEVTQGQWKAVMGTTPWNSEKFVKEGDDYPATNVGWEDAVEFCRKLSEKEGVEYRLPTEAEWEYACRAGTTTAYSFGDDESQLGEYAWIEENTVDVGEKYAHIVGQKKPNPWGLYDMHGNVFEWCQDWYGEYPSGAVTDPDWASLGRSPCVAWRLVRPSIVVRPFRLFVTTTSRASESTTTVSVRPELTTYPVNNFTPRRRVENLQV